MRSIKGIVGLMVFSAILSGCTLTGTYMETSMPAPQYNINGQIVNIHFERLSPSWIVNHNYPVTYRVGPFDILNIIVWDHPELTTQTTQLSGPMDSGFLVSDRGTIAYPFAGTLHVSGLSIPEIEKLIQHKISKYIRNPQVTVRVVSFRSQHVTVMGEVGGQKNIWLTDQPLTLLNALNQTGGTNVMTANTAHIYVLRGNVENLSVFLVDAKTPQMMMVMQQFVLQNNDIVYVPPLPITSWNRIINQLLPSFSAVASTTTVASPVK